MHPDSLAVTLHASAAETASDSGDAVDLQSDGVLLRRFIELALVITAASGTDPTLDVTVETSDDGTTWETVEAFAQQEAVGVVRQSFGDLKQYVRASWVIGGSDTPSFTFALSGTGLVTYATLTELGTKGVKATALTSVTTTQRIAQLVSSTEEARSYLVARFCAPILDVGTEVSEAVAKMAAVALLTSLVGINPTSNAHTLLITEKDSKISWLRLVSAGKAKANVLDSTPETQEGSGAVVVSNNERRGWGDNGVL